MNNKPISLIIMLCLSVGINVYNYTENDIILDSGEKIEAVDMPKHLTKAFSKRSVDKPLFITFHHTAGSKKQTVESIAKDQIKRGFAEFAYHFAIYEDGSLYAVNDINETTWHDSGENSNSIGVVFVGNYEISSLSDEAIRTATVLADGLCANLNIIGIRGHKDTSATLCPGKNAYYELKSKLFF